MKNNKKKIIIIVPVVIIICLIATFICLKVFRDRNVLILENNKNEVQKENTVTVKVLENSYKVSIKEGGTIYDAMNDIKNIPENNFSFVAKEYSTLGVFVEEINGIKGENGKYWIYSVNGEEGNVSVSKYFIKNGDNILWEQKSL